MVTDNKIFLKCTHVSGVELFVWLTNSEIYKSADSWSDSRVWAFEDHNGEMIEVDVRISDLDDFSEV